MIETLIGAVLAWLVFSWLSLPLGAVLEGLPSTMGRRYRLLPESLVPQESGERPLQVAVPVSHPAVQAAPALAKSRFQAA